MLKILRPLALILLITLVGCIFRLYRLGYYSLWLDEIGQVVVSGFPISQLVMAVSTHLSPPLDYLLLKMVLFWGSSDFVVRLPACIFGITAIPVIFIFGRKLIGKETAAIASLLLAVSPMAIAFSQETRMYSLFLLISLLVYFFTIRFLEVPTVSSAAVLATMNGVIVLTHYFGFVVLVMELVVCGIVAFHGRWKREWLYLFIVFLVPAFIFLPWLPMLIKQIKSSGGQISYALKADKNYVKFIMNAFSIYTGGEEGPWYYFYVVTFIAGLVMAIIVKNFRIVLLGAIFITVVTGSYLFSLFKPIVTTRNLIFLLPLYLLICAYLLNQVRKAIHINLWFTSVVLVLFLLPPVYHYHFAGRPDYKPDWKGAAKYLDLYSGYGEKIFIPDRFSRGCLAYYLEPDSDYVFMKPEWRNERNNPENRIWLVRPKREEFMEKGWLVLPPVNFEGLDREAFKEMVGNTQPDLTFRTQGKGNPLEIYRLD